MDMEKHVGYVLNADIRRKWQKQIKQAEEAMEMYKSPIEIMLTEMQVKMENGIMKAVRDVGVNVDATELLKALAYDREQYKKGYADGLEAGYEWISVEDRLPEEGQIVAFIPSCNHGSVYVGVLTNIGKRGGVMFSHMEGRYKSNYYAKHWMPLPEPPKEE